MLHVTIPITLVVGFFSAIAANLLYMAWQWRTYVLAIPEERHSHQALQIVAHEKRIAELTAPRPIHFRAFIQGLTFTSMTYQITAGQPLSVGVVLHVRYFGDDEMSVHSVRLHLEQPFVATSNIFQGPRPLTGRVWVERIGFTFASVVQDQARNAQLPGSRWKFTFQDVYDNEYESEIFTWSGQ